MRLIDADALLKTLGMADGCDKCPNSNNTIFCSLPSEMVDVCEAITDAPIIDPVKRGKWTYDDESNTGIYAICSACGESVYQAGEWLYCPRCGAQMERSEE